MRVLITGATSGIGRELAINYAEMGYQVIACGRDEEKLCELSKQQPSIYPLCFNLLDYDDYPAIPNHLAPIDLLILNAGDCEYIDDALNFNARLFERVVNINLIALGYCLEAWLKSVRVGGRLVLISSSAGLLPLPRAEAYGSSKAAVSYLGKSLAVSLKNHDISVSIVHPGFVETPLTDKNTFAMPMIISSEVASKKIISGIEKGQLEINFPSSFVRIMKVLNFLPSSLWNRLAARMG